MGSEMCIRDRSAAVVAIAASAVTGEPVPEADKAISPVAVEAAVAQEVVVSKARLEGSQ